MTLTEDQARALREILAVEEPGGKHLLTGYAGSGKTTLMQRVAAAFQDQGKEVAVTAPTHKAVSVLACKMDDAGLDGITCLTVHALLGLKPVADGPRTVLKRGRTAKVVTADVVILDECSMVGVELLGWIRKMLPHCFVLFVGDPAQLPPVNEPESATFATKSRSHLDSIVRQAVGNPVLDAAHVIRRSQGGPLDWSWCRDARSEKQGVFVPGQARRWMQQAFTSDRFKADNDQYRYLCWTNERVAQVNNQVRRWIYDGDTPTPFTPGERVLMRAPVLQDDAVALATNEEAEVVSIEPGTFKYKFEQRAWLDAWTVEAPSWRMVLRSAAGLLVRVHLPRDPDDLVPVEGRLLREAKQHGARWQDRFDFRQALAQMQAIYAMTVHTSQGSTFGHAFVDVGDIRRRAKSNVLEAQQLLYVAATRPSQALVLVGAGAVA